ADLVTDFDPDLPLVPCLPGDINQVILNLVVNAAQAIAEAAADHTRGKGIITVRTRREGNYVTVRVEDTGTGISEHIRDRIFEPFFTTKGVGKGTGQGLSIVRSVVEKRLGGTIGFETEVNQRTAFIIRIPIVASEQAESDLDTPRRPRYGTTRLAGVSSPGV
ncbi:MAG: HAMP domain-containing sensor histidine kinase, partial [Thermoguttaceae bacterium]